MNYSINYTIYMYMIPYKLHFNIPNTYIDYTTCIDYTTTRIDYVHVVGRRLAQLHRLILLPCRLHPGANRVGRGKGSTWC